MSLLGYRKVIAYTKFEHVGIIGFWVMLRTKLIHLQSSSRDGYWHAMYWNREYSLCCVLLLSKVEYWSCENEYIRGIISTWKGRGPITRRSFPHEAFSRDDAQGYVTARLCIIARIRFALKSGALSDQTHGSMWWQGGLVVKHCC